jgi:hypothetical protein
MILQYEINFIFDIVNIYPSISSKFYLLLLNLNI